MDNTPLLSLPLLANKQALQTTFHDEALKALDALVMLSVIDRDLSSPPASPAEGDRYVVKAPGSGDDAWEDDNVVVFVDGHWKAHLPQPGWTCYVQDEAALIAWDGTAWQPALDVLGGGAANNLALLGVGTTADTTNPFSAKLNNALWAARTIAEGGDADLRCKMSKASAADTLSILLQDNFSGRAEIGLTGDDDLHFKVSPDGSGWTDALVLDKSTGAAKFGSALQLAGDITPAQITADQNDYAPAGAAAATVWQLSSDASRNLTGIAGGADGRIILLLNIGSSSFVLTHDDGSASTAACRFSLPEGKNVAIPAGASAAIVYDATASRWRLLTGPRSVVRYDVPVTVSAFEQSTARASISAALKGQLFGLTLSNNGSDAANDIDIAVGEAASTETDPVLMVLASALTKRLDAAWAAGTNQGGLDAGSIANTTYHVWLIQRSDTGVVDVLFSTSASSPAMPANYDRKRRIGSIIRVSGAILAFTQIGDNFSLSTNVVDVNGEATSSTAAAKTLTVPIGLSLEAIFVLRVDYVSLATAVLVTAQSATDQAPTTSNSATVAAATATIATVELRRRVDTLGRVRVRATSAGATYQLTTIGWFDGRGRGE